MIKCKMWNLHKHPAPAPPGEIEWVWRGVWVEKHRRQDIKCSEKYTDHSVDSNANAFEVNEAIRSFEHLCVGVCVCVWVCGALCSAAVYKCARSKTDQNTLEIPSDDLIAVNVWTNKIYEEKKLHSILAVSSYFFYCHSTITCRLIVQRSVLVSVRRQREPNSESVCSPNPDEKIHAFDFSDIAAVNFGQNTWCTNPNQENINNFTDALHSIPFRI